MNKLYSELVNNIKKEFPTFEVVEKESSFWMHALYIASLMRFWNPDFMESYVTVMFGKVYMPKRFIGSETGYRILRHERIHLLDAKKWPILFELSYLLFPLPFIITMRAYWEFRAYCESLTVEAETRGYVSIATIDFIVKQFTGSYYLWMFPFPNYLRNAFTRFCLQNGYIIK